MDQLKFEVEYTVYCTFFLILNNMTWRPWCSLRSPEPTTMGLLGPARKSSSSGI